MGQANTTISRNWQKLTFFLVSSPCQRGCGRQLFMSVCWSCVPRLTSDTDAFTCALSSSTEMCHESRDFVATASPQPTQGWHRAGAQQTPMERTEPRTKTSSPFPCSSHACGRGQGVCAHPNLLSRGCCTHAKENPRHRGPEVKSSLSSHTGCA